MTFGENVVVSGRPELALLIGGQTRHATYRSGSGTTSLVFRYALTEGEADTVGISVPDGAISTAQGLVRYASTKGVAPARVVLGAQSGHLVDAVRPTLVSADASANSNDVTLTWDEALDEDSVPTRFGRGFTVRDTSAGTNRLIIRIRTVSVVGRVVTLTLYSDISATDQLRVDYRVPRSTHPPLKDTLGNYAGGNNRATVFINRSANSPPEFPSGEDGVRSVDENTPANRNIGTPVAATDADSDRLTYSISGADAALFDVVASSGQLRTKAALHHESRDSYSFTMSVHDGKDIYGNSDTTIDDTISVTVTVNDVDEPPVITGAATVDDYDENGTGDVASYTADDPEGATTNITWSLGGTDRGDFEISDAGVVTFKNPPDYERPADSGGNNEYLVTVIATEEGGLRGTLDVTISVRDVNEAPTITGDEAPAFPENGVRAVATYRATDPERDAVTWSVSGTDSDDFEISETGVLTFVNIPDFENPADANQDNDYLVTVEARDDGSNLATLEVTVTVTNSAGPEEPTITTTSNPSPYRENGTGAVYTFRARDPQGRPVSWMVTGPDSHAFAISSSGVLTFRSPPDFESPADAGGNNVYEFTVVATDDQSLTDTLDVVVTVSDVNEGPEVSGSQSLSFVENQATDRILATYAATDPEDPSAVISRWSLSGSDAGDFTVSGGGELSFRNVPDFERPADSGRDNVYNFSVRASDGRNYGYLEVTVTVEDVNEAPVITTMSRTSFSYRESGTATIYTFSATDPEGGTIVWSTGGADGDDFAVTVDSRGRGVLAFSSPPDFENPADADRDNVYEVTVVARDSEGNRAELQVEVTVVDQNEGPEVSGSQSLSFAENQATDRILATYSATDPEDPGAVISRWSLSGSDAGDFAISGGGELSFRNVPDFERPADSGRDNVYNFSVRASDGRNYGYLEVTVTVEDVNEAPVITTTSRTSFTYRENGTATIYTFSATDPERGPVVWSPGGADGDDFTITADSRGRGVLTFASPPDFENPTDADRDNVYEVTVEARDDAFSAGTREVTVTVSDVNEGPVVSGVQSLSFVENQATDRILAAYAATDPEDPGAVISRWSLSGSDAGDFRISGGGELSFRNVPDFERPADSGRDNVYDFSVRASDGRNYGYLEVTVTVEDVNEAQLVTGTTSFSYRENGTATIYTFSATDPEGGTISWSPGGADGDDFAVTSDSRGRGVLAFSSPPDFENPADADRDNVYEVTVVARDSEGNRAELQVEVTVVDQNEGPEVSGVQSLSFAENLEEDRILAAYAATDPEDPGAVISRWSLSGSDAGDFRISGGGELSFRNVPDFERPADSGRDNVYDFSVRASDGRNYGYLEVTVTVEDVNEAPVITTTSRTSFTYRENGTATIYTFSAADPERAAISWSPGGADGDDFTVTADSRGRGVLTFASPPDFENPTDADRDNVYEVTVEVTDDQSLTDSVEVTVTVSDVNEGPVVSGSQSLSFVENQATDRILAAYAATDPEDPGAVISRWSLSGSDAGDFRISGGGELSFRNVPDFERPADSGRDNVYDFSVRASDGRNYGYLEVTVTVEDVNEAPVITTTSRTSFTYRENGTATIYTFSATDPERAAISWSPGGADGDDFTVTADSRGRGVLTFASPPDFENPTDADRDNVYEVTVEVTDDQSLTDSVEVTVTVSDVNEGPVVSGVQSLSFAENQATDRILAAYAATDPEDPGAVISRWSLSGSDAGDFRISGGGELSFRNVPDFERPADSGRDNVYDFSVRASDGRNYGYLEVTVTVEDVNEAPVITTTSRTSFTYRENGTATIYTFSATDPERGPVVWSPGGADGDDFTVTADSRGRGVLTFASPPDFENPTDADRDNVYEVTVEANATTRAFSADSRGGHRHGQRRE